MKVTVDSDQFAAVMTAYEIEGALRNKICPATRLARAEIKLDGEVESRNRNRVFFFYERETHAFTIDEIAAYFKYGGAVIGKWGKTRVLCFFRNS